MSNQRFPIARQSTVVKLIALVLLSLFIGILFFFGMIQLAFPAFSEDLNYLEGFASVISLSLIIGGLVFAGVEYINAENAKRHEKLMEDREKAKISYDIYRSIYEKLTDPEQEAARRWILENITINEDKEDLPAWYAKTHALIMAGESESATDLPKGQKAVKMTLNCLDYIGFIARHYWDMEDDSLDWISAPVAKIWRRIGPYVLYVRKLRHTTDYYLSAEYVGDLCVKWRQNKSMTDETYVPKSL